ncbi:MAG: stage III sporulation protein AF [Firmicutes bacterium]|nr:stage III sporulation protein AF [Bacillota bacterium]
MGAVTGWLIGILSIVILGTVVDILLSQSKTGKFVRSVFAAVTVLVIILPLPSIIKNGFNFDSSFIIQDELELDESYLAFAERVKLRSLASGVEAQLSADGFQNTSVSIEGDARGNEIKIQLVRVNLQNVVIDENKRHINKYEEIPRLVAGYLDIGRGQVIVHE